MVMGEGQQQEGDQQEGAEDSVGEGQVCMKRL